MEQITTLSENNFIRLLLPYLYKKGVRTLSEDELAKKLYPYYLDKKYNLVFNNMVRDRYADKVDIYEGMSDEKFFSGCIEWYSNEPNILHLVYDNNCTSSIERNVDPEILKLINEIADNLATRYKIESKLLNVYGYNPNRNYTILYGQSDFSSYESELITDGDIKSIKCYKFDPNIFYQDPSGNSLGRQYKKAIIKNIILDNASYAIKQGKLDEKLKKIEIYSKILDLDKLKKISEFANKIHDDKDSLLTNEKPYVRKLSLN